MNGYRTCKKCNREKTTNRFYGEVCISCAQQSHKPPKKKPLEKKCRRCNKVLPIGFFNKLHISKDGRDYMCRSCASIRHKEQRNVAH